MPQEIRVLKCCECHKFQTDIVKKAKKWMCKICGVQQSVMQEYGRGTGKECRLHVQKLNEAKGTENSVLFNEYLEKCNNSSTDTSEAVEELIVLKTTDEKNKWLTFLNGPEIPECNLSQIKINSKDVQQLIKKQPLKRSFSNEQNISFHNYEDEHCFDSQEVNSNKGKQKNEPLNISNVQQPDNESERNRIITVAKLDSVLQPRSQEISTKKSKWSEFIDKEEQCL